MKIPYRTPILLAALILGAATLLMAQDSSSPSQIMENQQQSWLPEELNNLVAPIALYPDPLLGQVLVASTYPLEVVEASQWLHRNSGLQGQALIDAAKQQPWDPSIQALVAVPDALEKLNQDIRWTTDLGNAFLAQQDDVMNAVQTMRRRAQADGRLSSTDKQVVQNEDQGGQPVVEILPANPEIIYVPVYDPFYIWGPPAYGYYPALYYPSVGFYFGSGFDLGFYFGGWGGWSNWGWGPNWYGHGVVVNNLFFSRYGFRDRYLADNRGRTIWRHNPDHRMNIPYANSRVAEQFGGTTASGRSPRWAIPSRSGNQITRNRSTSEQRFRSQSQTEQHDWRQAQSRSQTLNQGANSSERYPNAQQVVPFGRQSERNERIPQQSRPKAEAYGQNYQAEHSGDRGQRSYSSQAGSPSIQAYRFPQVQRERTPQIYRSNPGTGGNPGFSSRSFSQGRSGGNSGGGARGRHR